MLPVPMAVTWLVRAFGGGTKGFPCGKESVCNAGDLGSIPGLGRSPGEGKSYPLQYSGLENFMNYIAHGVAKSWTQLSGFHFGGELRLKVSAFWLIEQVIFLSSLVYLNKYTWNLKHHLAGRFLDFLFPFCLPSHLSPTISATKAQELCFRVSGNMQPEQTEDIGKVEKS